MARDVDERKTRQALRKLRAAKARAQAGTGPVLSAWEEEFLQSLEERLTTYGSAFNDPEKGDRAEALSALQSLKVREIDRKTRGKDAKSGEPGNGFARGNGLSRRKAKAATSAPCGVHAEEGSNAAPRPASVLLPPSPPPAKSSSNTPQSTPPSTAQQRRAAFRVISGGREDKTSD